MKRRTKLTSQQHQEHTEEKKEAQAPALEFSTADELLRHDALHTVVPPRIAQRLQESIGPLPPPSRSWWERLFGG